MRPIRPAVMSLGSNVGDRLANLQGAIDALADTPEVHVAAVSSVYETAPVDAPPDSPDFLNAILIADTTLSVAMLLDRVAGRRDGVRPRAGRSERPAHPRHRSGRRR